ncbi:HAD-like domain [Pseudocohnilembus persalinus]|uniref:5'-nucleotidase n=1 Tax=Pseudocohnilembus persalinus TaxID=266149 RepID=A0A0V0QT09_PSEPJ|nr:HAD-like domain [Pseudocohnilembus persalinus]|eukprot:KRX05350.1 HAD-like domain [Pseudocohnilembus persalinus]
MILGLSLAYNAYTLHQKIFQSRMDKQQQQEQEQEQQSKEKYQQENETQKNLQQAKLNQPQTQENQQEEQEILENEIELFLQKATSRNLRSKLQKFLPKFKWELQISAFSDHEQVIITDKNNLLQKLKNMKKDGIDHLQIVSDFDQTVTPFHHNQKMSPSTLGAVRICEDTPEFLKKELEKNFKYYYPIEQDPTIETEHKVKYMQEWNEKVGEAFKKSGITGEIFQKCADKANFAVRHLFKEFFILCSQVNLPFFYVSGGINAFVHTILDQITDINQYDNLFLNSQKAIFDKHQNQLIDMHMEVCTSSKHEILNKEIYDFKKNTILLGDSQHDILMGGNIEAENQISILFLNEKLADNIKDFQLEGWDIIIRDPTGQGSYIVALQILQEIGLKEFQKEKYDITLKSHKNIFQSKENYKEINEILCQLA